MGKIILNYGTNIQKITYDCLVQSNLSSLIKKGAKVIIKPNLVNSTKAADGATTHPEVVEGIINYLFDNDFRNVEILESSWAGGDTDSAFKICGYTDLSKKYNVPLLNAVKQNFKKVSYNGIDIDVCENVLDDVFLINVPVLKAHCQTQVTCCIKNLKGLITNKEKRNFHTMGLHEPIAALGAVIKIGFNVVDGICGDLTFEEGGNPVETNMIIAGEDPLLIDTFVSRFIGYDPDTIRYLTLSKKHGTGEFYNENTEVIVLNDDKKPTHSIKATKTAGTLAKYVNEKDACSVCYSSLIRALHKADKKLLKTYEENKIAIGQGYKNLSAHTLGFGNCTSGCDRYVKGCPPKALDLLEMLGKSR